MEKEKRRKLHDQKNEKLQKEEHLIKFKKNK